ncbi:MAG: hypothetical protein ACP5NS_04580 [Candidatus Pacearchaeota archaeon]
MKFNFRKIASALASTAMIGSTVALAAAANYPAPFVSGGSADVAIVYGNSLDLAAVTDISTSLSSALASGGTAAGASSEAYPLFTGSTPLQLNNSVNSVRSSITETNLPTALADSDFSGDVDADITFQIIPGSNPRTIFAKEPTSSDDPGMGVLLSTSAGNYFYNATATFSRAVAFNDTEDSEGETLSLFGKEFTVASATDGDTLVLFQSAQTSFLSVGGTSSVPSSTITVDGNTYTVELLAATDTSATIKVTDSSGNSDQKEINEASSKKILGLEVAVNTADESTATNTLSAEVIIGANKLTFEDATEVTVGSDADPIRGTKVDFNDGSPGNLTKLTLQVFAADDDEDFIQEGGEFVDPVFGGFRFVLSGLENNAAADREEISVGVSGSDKLTLDMTNWQGKSISNFVWLNNDSNAGGTAFLGDTGDNRIFVSEMAQINESSYTVVGNEDEGYLVKLRTLTNSSGTPIYTNDKVVFENVFDTAQSWDATITSEGSGTIDIGGRSYGVTYRDNGADNVDGDEHVRLDDLSTSGNTVAIFNTIETEKGAKFAFYEPTVVTLSNYDGLGSNVSSFSLPDGDGYTSVAISPPNQTGNGNYSINSVNVNTSVAGGGSSTLVTVGSLQYNFSSAGSATDTAGKVRIRLQDGVVPNNRPGLVLFEEQDESNVYNAITVQTSGAGSTNSGTGVSDIDFTWDGDTDMGTGTTAWGATGVSLESDDDMYQMMDQWGTLVTTDQSDSDQYTSIISYPDEQVSAMLYVDSIASGSSSTTLGDVKLMDDELSSSGMSGKNLIVVGGSCVNTAASTLLGGSAACGSSWTAATGASSGEWIIQTFANPWGSSKVATLVAGWEQGDTANAATYLTTQNPVTSVGHKLTGTTGTAATVVTA